jgi:hypothetical protein
MWTRDKEKLSATEMMFTIWYLHKSQLYSLSVPVSALLSTVFIKFNVVRFVDFQY